jgi:hypothetical protein
LNCETAEDEAMSMRRPAYREMFGSGWEKDAGDHDTANLGEFVVMAIKMTAKLEAVNASAIKILRSLKQSTKSP